jgi:hypothetical protein
MPFTFGVDERIQFVTDLARGAPTKFADGPGTVKGRELPGEDRASHVASEVQHGVGLGWGSKALLVERSAKQLGRLVGLARREPGQEAERRRIRSGRHRLDSGGGQLVRSQKTQRRSRGGAFKDLRLHLKNAPLGGDRIADTRLI